MTDHKENGIKLTPQRIEIMSYLSSHHHPSADDIYRAVSRKLPTMSLATVYNTLEMLKRRGDIRELTIDPGRKRYDLSEKPHHHLFCVRCRKIRDVEMNQEPVLPLESAEGFKVLGCHVEFYVVCPDCREGEEAC